MPRLVQRPSEQPPLFWRADPAGRWTWSCDSWTAFTGLSEAASRGDGWLEAVHPADRTAASARWVVAPGGNLRRVPFRLKCAADGEAYREVLPRAAHALDPDGGVDLESLIGEELVAHRVGDADLSVEGPHLRLKGRAADAFVFALHELVVNAVKFGALTSPRGTVSIAWTIDRATDPPVLHFEWCETGVRVAGPAPRRRGFGTEVIERSLPYELNATARLDFLPGAVRCVIALPLTDDIAYADPS